MALTIDDVKGRPTITVTEAAQLLNLNRDGAYAAARAGELPVIRMGRRMLVPVPKLLAMLGAADEAHAAQ